MRRRLLQFLRFAWLPMVVLLLGAGAYLVRKHYLDDRNDLPRRVAEFKARQSLAADELCNALFDATFMGRRPNLGEIEQIVGAPLITTWRGSSGNAEFRCDLPREGLIYRFRLQNDRLYAWNSTNSAYRDVPPRWWAPAEAVRTWGLLGVSLLWLVGFFAVAWDKGLRDRFAWLTLNLALLALFWWLTQPPWQFHFYSLWWEHGHWIGAGMIALTLIAIVWPRRARPADSIHCPSCGYNLTGNVSGICPECGKPTPARLEQNLLELAQSLNTTLDALELAEQDDPPAHEDTSPACA